MKEYKIYGESYPLKATTKHPVDSYARGGVLVDDPPKGKILGYVEMDDGSIIECHKKTNYLPLIVFLIVLVLVVASILVYLLFFQPKDVELAGTVIKHGTDNNIVKYDGFMTLDDSGLRVSYQNGDIPAQIIVHGDGVESQQVYVEPGQFIDYIPCKFTTKNGVVEAQISIMTETSKQDYNVVVEIPANNNGNDTQEGLTGLFDGEVVYGVSGSEQ